MQVISLPWAQLAHLCDDESNNNKACFSGQYVKWVNAHKLFDTVVKNPPANAGGVGDASLIPGSRNVSRKWHSCSSILVWKIPWTEEPDRAMVHEVAKSRTGLSRAPTAFRIMPEHKHLWSELAIQVTWANFSLYLANFISPWRNLNYTISIAFHPQLKANKYWKNISFLSFIPKITTDDKDDTQGLFSSEFWGRSNKQWGWNLELANLWGSGSSLPNCQC